jgi:hypothetical protein
MEERRESSRSDSLVLNREKVKRRGMRVMRIAEPWGPNRMVRGLLLRGRMVEAFGDIFWNFGNAF